VVFGNYENALAKVERMQKRHRSVITILAEEIDEMKRVPLHPARRIGFRVE
jgi:hypothetical protein